MANRAALRELQTRLASRLQAARTEGSSISWLAIKADGKHVINKKGDHTVSVEVKNGKIAALHVKHAKKGDLPIKKYKTDKKMASAYGLQYASMQLAQAQSLGTVWIGYAYYDDYGDEEIYWFPYEMILDGDTGAVDYVPIY